MEGNLERDKNEETQQTKFPWPVELPSPNLRMHVEIKDYQK